jgi:hypothetical protein
MAALNSDLKLFRKISRFFKKIDYSDSVTLQNSSFGETSKLSLLGQHKIMVKVNSLQRLFPPLQQLLMLLFYRFRFKITLSISCCVIPMYRKVMLGAE